MMQREAYFTVVIEVAEIEKGSKFIAHRDGREREYLSYKIVCVPEGKKLTARGMTNAIINGLDRYDAGLAGQGADKRFDGRICLYSGVYSVGDRINLNVEDYDLYERRRAVLEKEYMRERAERRGLVQSAEDGKPTSRIVEPFYQVTLTRTITETIVVDSVPETFIPGIPGNIISIAERVDDRFIHQNGLRVEKKTGDWSVLSSKKLTD